MLRATMIFTACCALIACGGSNNESDPDINQPNTQPFSIDDYEKLTKTDIEPSVLKTATAAELEQHLKNGLRLNAYPIYYITDIALEDAAAPIPSPTPVASPVVEARDGSLDENFTVTAFQDSDITPEGTPVPVPTGTPAATPSATITPIPSLVPTPTPTFTFTPTPTPVVIDDVFEDIDNSDNYSTTNVHVEGVDEADFVKYDGEHIFMVTNPHYTWGEERPNAAIRILATDPANASVRERSSIPLNDNNWGEVSEIYLTENEGQTENLVTLRSSWNEYGVIEPAFTDVLFDSYIPYSYGKNQIQLVSYDVSTPEEPTEAFKIEIDGYIQDSRKVGNTMYLVSYHSPYIPYLDFYAYDENGLQTVEDQIAALTLDDLLPKVSINGGEEQPLLAPEDCLVPVDLDEYQGYLNIVSILAINLETNTIESKKCLNTSVQGIYVNEDNLFIGGSKYQSWFDFQSFTVVHKFSLTDGIDYVSTGAVPGYMGWNDPSFRMDEKDGYFRIVTTERDDSWTPIHRLTILQDSSTTDEMEVVSELPNDSRPDPIGKPNEDIYSVRFDENRAYIVTFQRTDPLYLINLDNPEDPYIDGELEVPGFSDYLHPINDNYLIGVGNDADTNGFAQGVKVTLFDVSNPSSPQELNSLVFGERGSSSAASYDLRAFASLTVDNDFRFTLPIRRNGLNWTWLDTGLYLFEVEGVNDSNASLSFNGSVISESSSASKSWPNYGEIDRGILHDDAVFYMHGEDLWTTFWHSPAAVKGPY